MAFRLRLKVYGFSVPGCAWAPLPISISVGSAGRGCPSFCTTLPQTERDSADLTDGAFALEMSPLIWRQCEVRAGRRACLPAGIPHSRGKNRQQMGRWGSLVCAVGQTAADVASLNHLHTSASEPDLILDGRLTLSFPPLQLPFKDEVLGSRYKLVVFCYGHETPLTSPGSSHTVRRGTWVLQQTEYFYVFWIRKQGETSTC